MKFKASLSILAASAGIYCSAPVWGETQSFAYDSLGRLIATFRSGGPNDGKVSKSNYDALGNRSSYVSETASFRLNAGQSHVSPDGRFSLIMQTDGNLVLYQLGVAALWATGTSGPNFYAVFQTDGNLVVYTSGNSPVWSSATGGNTRAYLSVQNDGNTNIYNGAGQVIWSTNTCCR